MADFTLPELGESITSGDVLRVLVKAGDTVAKEQPVLELETDKATIEVPSSIAGVVTDVKVKVGEKVKVGQVILTVESAGQAAAAPAGPPPASPAAPERPAAAASKPAAEETAEPRTPRVDKVVDVSRPSTSSGRPERFRSERVEGRGALPTEPEVSDGPAAPAAPSVRRMARELAVDINEVAGSEAGGRISIEDVKAHARRLLESAAAPIPGAAPVVAKALPDFSRWGEIERQPMRAVRKKTAEHLSAAWIAIPHVTQHDAADITDLEELRKRYAKQVEAAGGNLTLTSIAVKICAAALKVFPQFNVSIDLAAEEIIFKKYVNIGIAVDTDRGLLVPVIRDADAKNVIQLSVELSQLSEKARTRKISLDEMQGGSFSISNLGGIGGRSFTPIVNAPEVAILGISRARMEPVYLERGRGPATNDQAQFVPRLILPLSLSYDHRAIDGADGARFLRWVAEAFEQPLLLALQG